MLVLQQPHKRPRTLPVAWQWSMCMPLHVEGSSILSQIAHLPDCFAIMRKISSGVRPYFLLIELRRLLARDFSGLASRQAFTLAAAAAGSFSNNLLLRSRMHAMQFRLFGYLPSVCPLPHGSSASPDLRSLLFSVSLGILNPALLDVSLPPLPLRLGHSRMHTSPRAGAECCAAGIVLLRAEDPQSEVIASTVETGVEPREHLRDLLPKCKPHHGLSFMAAQ